MKRSILVSTAVLIALASRSSSQCERARVLPEGETRPARFGAAVAVHSGRLAVGTRVTEEVWIHTLQDRHAYLDDRLTSPAPPLRGFGGALDLSDEFLVVGAPCEGGGAVYVYEAEGSGFVQIARLVASPSALGAKFGSSVAIDGARIVVGERYARTGKGTTGAVTVFDPQGPTWVQTARLLGAAATNDDEFGRSVALDGDRIAVGAPNMSTSLSTRPDSPQPSTRTAPGGITIDGWEPGIKLTVEASPRSRWSLTGTETPSSGVTSAIT